mmetsp:Transcript_33912/g.102422  ORF Transcript_33912/g.102422 Transcript_33912/m.102422 type:complete len:233 (+) Transcript_33912:251-949(+)
MAPSPFRSTLAKISRAFSSSPPNALASSVGEISPLPSKSNASYARLTASSPSSPSMGRLHVAAMNSSISKTHVSGDAVAASRANDACNALRAVARSPSSASPPVSSSRTAANSSAAVRTPSPSASNNRNCWRRWPISASVSSAANNERATRSIACMRWNRPSRCTTASPCAASAETCSAANHACLNASVADGRASGSFASSVSTSDRASGAWRAQTSVLNGVFLVWIARTTL